MKKKEWLIFRIFDLLSLLDPEENQPIVNQIRGLLYELLNED